MFTVRMTGREIKLWRRERELNQQALAAILGVSLPTLRQWEQERCPAHVLLRIALQHLAEHPEMYRARDDK